MQDIGNLSSFTNSRGAILAAVTLSVMLVVYLGMLFYTIRVRLGRMQCTRVLSIAARYVF